MSVLAQTVPLVGSSVVADEREKQKRSLKEAEASLLHNNVNVDLVINDKSRMGIVLEKNPSVQAVGPVSSTGMSENMPAKPLSECNPDIGIFSCGLQARCVESQESTLGGFCVEYQKARSQRHLQDGGLCEDIYVDCDCGNVTDSVGSYTCTRPGECIDQGGQVCGTFQDVISIEADGSYSKSSCFMTDSGVVENSFDASVGSYCYSVVNDGIRTTECVLEIDGVECSSCNPILCDGGSSAARLDCTNVNSVASGDSCSGGLNVLDLLSGALTSPPTSATEPTASPLTGDSPAPSPVPTSEPTSGASRLMKGSVLVAAVAVLASLVVA